MSFWCLQFPPKNEQKQVDLRFHGGKVELVCLFFEKTSPWKKLFWLFLTFTNVLHQAVVYIHGKVYWIDETLSDVPKLHTFLHFTKITAVTGLVYKIIPVSIVLPISILFVIFVHDLIWFKPLFANPWQRIVRISSSVNLVSSRIFSTTEFASQFFSSTSGVEFLIISWGVEIITKLSRAARCALIVSTVSDLDQSAARNLGEATEICCAYYATAQSRTQLEPRRERTWYGQIYWGWPNVLENQFFSF